MKDELLVRFRERKSAEDLYWCEERKKVFLRQPYGDHHVRWLTTTDCMEADCSLREGMTLHVVDLNGKELFQETIVRQKDGDPLYAVKSGPFSYEALKSLEKEYASRMFLRSYEGWKRWLMDSAEEYGFVGCSDSWLYDADHEPYRTRAILNYLGKRIRLASSRSTHRVCKKSWIRFQLMDESLETCLGLCGFQFDPESRGKSPIAL